MIDIYVKKLIARLGERELVDSSAEEMQCFIVDRHRPSFEDENILCIKFIQSYSPSMEFAEESSWFINPCYVKDLSACDGWASEVGPDFLEDMYRSLASSSVDDEVAMEFAATYGYSPKESYGPKMAAEFLPELLILQPQYPEICMFRQYEQFHSELMKYNLTALHHEEKLKLFAQYFKYDCISKKSNIIYDYWKTQQS